MDAKRHINDSGSLLAGGLLILVGLIFLAVTQGLFNLSWTNFWPILPTVAGLYVLTLAALAPDRARRGGLVLGGTIPFLVGLFFFATTMGFISWEMQGRLWPVYPLIVGVAFLAAFFVSGLQAGYLIPAIVLTMVGGAFLPFTVLDTNYDYLGKFWPVIPIAVGVVLLLSSWMRRNSAGTRNG
jgi:Domain of unknown function (DUF5668)